MLVGKILNKKIKFASAFIIVALVAVGLLFAVSPLLAQSDNFGAFRTAAGAGDVGLVTLIGRIVQIILGLLGVIAVVLLIYAGFTWMTAGGDPNKVVKAQKIITGTIIGLVIIFASFAIVSFIMSRFDVTPGTPGTPCNVASGDCITPDGCTGIHYCVNGYWGHCINTEPDCPPNLYFSKQFSYVSGLSDPAFPRWTRFRNLSRGFSGIIQLPTSTSLIVYGYAHDKDNFIERLELNPRGRSALEFPNSTSVIKTVNGKLYNVVAAAAVNWNTSAYAGEATTSIFITAFSGTGSFDSRDLSVRFWPAHCFDGQKNGNETDVDCGGDCPNCDGQSCNRSENPVCADDNCASGLCLNSCICAGNPKIDYISPATSGSDGITDFDRPTTTEDDLANGAPGNLITIWGRYFGVTPGRVVFRDGANTDYPVPLDLGPNCTGTWSNNQIIVKVPDALALGNYQVEVVNTSTNLASNRRPFAVNNIERPGICLMIPSKGAYPSSTDIYGIKFPTVSPQVVLWEVSNRYFQVAGGHIVSTTSTRENMTSTAASGWTGNFVTDIPPQNKLGRAGVRVYNGTEYSNYFLFQISAGGEGEPCGYDSSVCGQDTTTCQPGLTCSATSCTCQSLPGFCVPGVVSTTPNNERVPCNLAAPYANCGGFLTCNTAGSDYYCAADPTDVDCPNYLTAGNMVQSIYSYAFTAVKNGGEGDACGYNAWGECDINGCDKGFVCNINGGGERQWIELYNPTGQSIDYGNYLLEIYNFDDSSTKNYTLAGSLSPAVNRFFVINKDSNSNINPDIPLDDHFLPARGRIILKKNGTQEDIIEYGTGTSTKATGNRSYGRSVDGTSTPFVILNQSSKQSANSASPAYSDAAAVGRVVINEVYVGTPPCTCALSQPCKVGEVDKKTCPPLGACAQIRICNANGFWDSCVLADPNCIPYVAAGNAAQSIFSWAFVAKLSDATDEPYVIESCNRTIDCNQGQPLGSPSPWYEGEDYQEDGINVGWTSTTNSNVLHPKACLDSVIKARFNVKMYGATINNTTVKVFECSSRSGGSCLDVTDEFNAPVMSHDNNSIEYDQLTLVPKNDLASDKWYKVLLLDLGGNNVIKSDFNKPLKKEKGKVVGRQCAGVGGYSDTEIAYCWNFQTRNSANPTVDGPSRCNVGCVECQPNPWTAWWYGYQTAHDATPVADDNVCIALDATNYDWQWAEKEYSGAANPTEAEVKADANWTAPAADPYASILSTTSPYNTSTALRETIFNNPNFVRISATESQSQRMGYCRLHNDFTNPIVVEDRFCTIDIVQSPTPYKGTEDACINAWIGARFSRPMQDVSLFSNFNVSNTPPNQHPNIIIQRCASLDAVTSTDLADCQNVISNGGFIFRYSHSATTFEQLAAVSNPDAKNNPEGFLIVPVDGSEGNTLKPNTWYRVIIKGGEDGVRGTTGTPEIADGILMRTTLDYTGDGANDYMWYFKTGSVKCPIHTVGVSPFMKFMSLVRENELYTALPQAANCNVLDPNSYTWAWRSLFDLADDTAENDATGGTGIGVARICSSTAAVCNSYENVSRFQSRVFGVNEGFVNIKARVAGSRGDGADWNDPVRGDKWGYGNLQIGYGDLLVSSYYPLNTVCRNPAIGVGFNMDAAVNTFSLNTNVKLYGCDEGFAYYPLDGDGNDRSGNNYNGMVSSSQQYAGGKFGSAMQFDGQSISYVEVTTTALRLDEDITVSAWVKLDSQSELGRMIASTYAHNSGSPRGWYLGNAWGSGSPNTADDSMEFRIHDDSAGVSAGINNFTARYGNNFVQVVGVFKSGQYIKLFINGQEVASTQTSIDEASYLPAIPMRIGQRADNYDQGLWDGLIDEVRIYNRALTANDVKKLYDSNADGCPFIYSPLPLAYNPAPTSVYAKQFFMTTTASLVPGNNYRVVIKGGPSGIKAWNQKPLAGLNFKANSTSAGGEECEPDLYPWNTVKVGSSNACSNTCVLNSSLDLCGTQYSQCTTSTISTNYCTDTCHNSGNRNVASCGDRIIGPTEECDDGNMTSNDGCSSNCLAEGSRGSANSVCGNGRVEIGEICDDGNETSGDGCSSSCLKESGRPSGSATSSPICGNGVREKGESCDDGNIQSGDGCRGTESGNGCIFEGSSNGAVCGDKVIETGQYDSFSWAFKAGTESCAPSEIILNPCPNGIWRFKLNKVTVSSTIIIYKQMEAGSRTDCEKLAYKPKPANFFAAAISKIKDVMLKLLGIRKASAALQWCPISTVRFTADDLREKMRKGFFDKTENIYTAGGATANAMEIIGYTDESDSYVINYHNNTDWSLSGVYRAKVLTDDGSGLPSENRDSVQMYGEACRVRNIIADIWPRGQTKDDDAFFCHGDLCGRATSDNDPTNHSDEYDDDMSAEWTKTNSYYDLKETASDYKTGNQHLYRLWALGDNNYLLKSAIVQQVRDLDGVNISSAELKVNNTTTAYTGDSWITGGDKNGEAALLVTSTGELGEAVTTTITIWNFLCNNPWPAPPYFPFKDISNTNCLSTGAGTCFKTNFLTYYCRDAGDASTTADDLPALPTTTPPSAAAKVVVKKGNTAFEACPNLPVNFVPVLGYTDALTGSQINLWGTNNDHLIKRAGDDAWNLIASGVEANQGLPSNFKPKIGYYYPSDGGKINLWDGSGRLYVGRISGSNILWSAGNNSQKGLPANFIPNIGYFSGSYVYLWFGRTLYQGTVSGGQVNYVTLTVSDLPSNFIPYIGYYNSSQFKQVVWNAAGKRYTSSNGTAWAEYTFSGLPADFHPKVGYFDGAKETLWDGQRVFSSSNGTAFSAEYYFNATCDINIKDFYFGATTTAGGNIGLGIRVVSNNNHYSPLYWYQTKFVKGQQGNPKAVEAGGYQGIIEGRTAYINAVNVEIGTPGIYTNMYIMSYDQDVGTEGANIFNQMVNNWEFNRSIAAGDVHGVCTDGSASVNPEYATYYCADDASCRRFTTSTPYFCNSSRAKLARDARRLADIQDINVLLTRYYNQGRCSNDQLRLCSDSNQCYGGGVCGRFYPALKSGTYIIGKSFSVWPSWLSNLGNSLGTALPADPINKFFGCSSPYNPITCWNEQTKLMDCPDDASVYQYMSQGTASNLLIKSEYDITKGTLWRPAWGRVNFLRTNPFLNYNVNTMCNP